MKHLPASCVFFAIATLFLSGCGKKTKPLPAPQGDPDVAVEERLSDEQKKIKAISESENLIQSLASQMKLLGRSLTVDGADASSIVSSDIQYIGLDAFDLRAATAAAEASSTDPWAVSLAWPIAQLSSTVSFQEIWKPLLDFHRFESSQIGILKGSFPDDSDHFEMETKFEGRFQAEGARIWGVKGYQTLVWEKNSSGDWNLAGWIQKKLSIIAAKQPFFENVTESAIPDEATHTQLMRSSHQEMIVKHSGEVSVTAGFKEARNEYRKLSDWASTFQYPAVSVLDLDQDGYDDLFVTDRWQPALLLRNKGNGTFQDVTESSGLVVDELANCTYFFDFDNDGDSDALVGISMGPSKFFINENGTFEPHVETNELLEETRFVVAASVADVNRDGLLDVYLSTYAFAGSKSGDWFNIITRPEDRLKTRLKIQRGHTYVDRGGPPNILLMNRGGKFEWVKIDDELKQYRDSYQSTWTDWDSDGDLDLFICNDFAPDVFLQNDTPQGSFKPNFTNVTVPITGNAAMGYAMGASWGDYDNDGDLDLYISNMYSKAGMRIVSQLDEVDERIRVSARGNFLYAQRDGKFEQVAGFGDNDQHVSTAGWSYGGQFADFDNDGHLDIYVPCGFYSAPKEIQTDKDL